MQLCSADGDDDEVNEHHSSAEASSSSGVTDLFMNTIIQINHKIPNTELDI